MAPAGQESSEVGVSVKDYLSHLVARTLDPAGVIQPRLASLFEPPSAFWGAAWAAAEQPAVERGAVAESPGKSELADYAAASAPDPRWKGAVQPLGRVVGAGQMSMAPTADAAQERTHGPGPADPGITQQSLPSGSDQTGGDATPQIDARAPTRPDHATAPRFKHPAPAPEDSRAAARTPGAADAQNVGEAPDDPGSTLPARATVTPPGDRPASSRVRPTATAERAAGEHAGPTAPPVVAADAGGRGPLSHLDEPVARSGVDERGHAVIRPVAVRRADAAPPPAVPDRAPVPTGAAGQLIEDPGWRAEPMAAPVQGRQVESAPAPAPIVRVSIGRVEVRAVMPPLPVSAPAAAAPSVPTLSLDAYLERRNAKR